MSFTLTNALKRASLPEDTTLRWALGILAAMAVADCGALLFHNRTSRSGVAAQGSAPAEAQNLSGALMIQPRLEVPTVRASWQHLLEESRGAAARGQTAQALKILADAEPQLPQLPFAFAELANQFEKLGASDRAYKLWERVYQYGASAGVYFSAAESKLRLLAELGADYATAPAASVPVRKPAGAALAGEPVNPVRFGKISLRDAPDGSSSARHFWLTIPILSGGQIPLEAKDIDIEVQFYDQIRGKTLERTNGFIQWKWVNNAMNWKAGSTPKLLEVEFRQGPARKAGENRAYFGYVASVYYREKLQDYRCDPPRLGQQYPPPRLLPRESAP